MTDSPAPTVATGRTALRTAADAPDGARVPVGPRLTVRDPFDADRRARDGRDGFSAETTGGQSGWGRRRDRPHVGVRFHPESVPPENGKRLVANFANSCGGDDV